MVPLVEQILELHKPLHDAETTAADREHYQRQIDATNHVGLDGKPVFACDDAQTGYSI